MLGRIGSDDDYNTAAVATSSLSQRIRILCKKIIGIYTH